MNFFRRLGLLNTMLTFILILLVAFILGKTILINSRTSEIQQNLKGRLLIYDPSATSSELYDQGFKSLTWYLVPKDIIWPGSPLLDPELIFTDYSICDDMSQAGNARFTCEEPLLKWGYGDRVRIWGSKSGNVITVTTMEIVSSLPVEEW